MTADGTSLTVLGSGGGRATLIKRLRRTSALLLRHEGTTLVLDPGHGALDGLHDAGVDPTRLDGVVISHFHLDHVVEANLLVEGMSLPPRGGGLLAAPEQALHGEDRVLYMYRRAHLDRVVTLAEGEPFSVGAIKVDPVARYRHANAETFRFEFAMGGKRLAYFGDGRSLAGARRMAGADLAVVHCLLPVPIEGVDHLDPGRTIELLAMARPRRVLLTHFGGGALEHGLVEEMRRRVEEESGTRCEAAEDMATLTL